MQQHIRQDTDLEKSETQFKSMSQVYEERKTQLVNSIISSPENTPTKKCAFKPNTLQPVEVYNQQGRTRRPRQPRAKWVETAMEMRWNLIKREFEEFRYEQMDLEKPEHIEIIKFTAGRNLNAITPNYLPPSDIRERNLQ